MNLFDNLYNLLLTIPINEAISYAGQDAGAREKGDEGESLFASILSRQWGRGFYNPNATEKEKRDAYQRYLNGDADWYQATMDQERLDHYDFGVREGERDVKYEVKSSKSDIVARALSRLKINDPRKGIFVELQGVTGRPGWVFGKADWIAFKNRDDTFTLWSLEHIRKEVISSGVMDAPIVGRIEDALYKKYQRYGKRDFVTILSADSVKAKGGKKTIFR